MALDPRIDHRGMNKELGHVTQYGELNAIVNAIVAHDLFFFLPSGERIRTKIMAGGQCVAVDHEGHRYVSQNTTKKSAEAKRARAGSQIIWVIKTHNALDVEGSDEYVYHPLDTHEWVGKIEDSYVRMK